MLCVLIGFSTIAGGLNSVELMGASEIAKSPEIDIGVEYSIAISPQIAPMPMLTPSAGVPLLLKLPDRFFKNSNSSDIIESLAIAQSHRETIYSERCNVFKETSISLETSFDQYKLNFAFPLQE